jgi:hypothetical protein
MNRLCARPQGMPRQQIGRLPSEAEATRGLGPSARRPTLRRYDRLLKALGTSWPVLLPAAIEGIHAIRPPDWGDADLAAATHQLSR